MEHRQSREFLEAPDFKDELATIVSTPLSAENIDTYADDALNNLVALVRKTVNEYESRPIIEFTTQREQEEAAFGYFGLQNVEAILDHIADKSDETHRLDDYINSIRAQDRTILPPDELEQPSPADEGAEFREKRTVPRLKTLLFILTNEFDVDLDNKDDIDTVKGTNDPTMMRGESYYAVDIPKLERQVFINDEIGNATIILDSKKLEESGLSFHEMQSYTKQSLGELIAQSPTHGTRLLYDKYFTQKLIHHLETPFEENPTAQNLIEHLPEPTFLLPKTENGKSISQLASEWGVNYYTIQKASKRIPDELGILENNKNGKWVSPSFNDDQQTLLYNHLEARGMFAGLAPEDFLSLSEFARLNNFNLTSAVKWIGEVSDEIGDVAILKRTEKARPTKFYSPSQQAIIIENFSSRGILRQPPEGYLSRQGLASDMGVSPELIKKLLKEYSEEIGPLEEYFHAQKVTISISPEQQQKLKDILESQKPPEGYINFADLTRLLGRDDTTVIDAIEVLGDAFGEIHKYRFGFIANGFSPKQQQMLTRYFDNPNKYVNKFAEAQELPEGFKTIPEIARDLDVSTNTIMRRFQDLGITLNDRKTYRIHNKMTAAYSAEEQVAVRELLDSRNVLVPEAPAGYVSFKQLANELNISSRSVWNAIQELGAYIGDVETYRVGSLKKPAQTYSLEQQEQIKAKLDEKGLLAPIAPLENMSATGMARKFGISKQSMKNVLEELKPNLGEIAMFRHGNVTTSSFNPKQQALVEAIVEGRF